MDQEAFVGSQRAFVVVVGLKLDDEGALAFERAAQIARRIPRAEVHAVHVLVEPATEAKTNDIVGHLRLYLDDKVKALGGMPGVVLGVHVRSGSPAAEIRRFAFEADADLVVLGSGKRRLREAYAAPVAERVAEDFVVVIAGPRPRPRRAPTPSIEPPCPDCVRARHETRGEGWWCARHSVHAARAHTYSYRRELSLRTHDSDVIPTGIEYP